MQFIIIFYLFLAYLIGSISSAIIICKLMGLPDPRTTGSLNPGATNVLRLGNKKAAALTLLGDVLKGFIPVGIAGYFGFNSAQLAMIALAAFLGHLFPIFFRFKGGKGVATLIGALLALSWPTGLSWLAVWALTAFVFRYSSLASIMASFSAPLFILFFTGNFYATAIIAIMSLLVLLRHRANIISLWQGKERKIGQKLK